MKIKIIKTVQYYFNEGDVIDTYTDDYCKSLINSGIAISLDEKKEDEEAVDDKKKDDVVKTKTTKTKQNKNK